MKRYVKSSEEFSTEELKDSCFEEVMEYITQSMDDGEYFSYDDVVSDVYAGIQDYFYKMDIELDDITEDDYNFGFYKFLEELINKGAKLSIDIDNNQADMQSLYQRLVFEKEIREEIKDLEDLIEAYKNSDIKEKK